MDLKPLQPEKQKSPNDITDDGISMVVKLLQKIVFTTDYYSIFYR